MNSGQCRTRSFWYSGSCQGKAQRPRKGQEPAGDHFSHRDLSRRTGYPYVNFVTD